jgi:Family of unknown function (DUF5719)
VRAVRLVPAAVAVVALAAIGGIAELGHPAAANSGSASIASRQVAVTSAARACPPTAGNGSGPVALIAGLGPVSATAGQGAARGQAELTALPMAGQSLRAPGPLRAQTPGALSLLTVPAGPSTATSTSTSTSTSTRGAPAAQGWSVSATGAMARAVEAELAQGSGVGSVRCGEPGSDTWFLGPGQRSGASQVQLDLMNIDSLAASVDVSVITDAGQAQAGNDTGITVPPHQTVTESLSGMASGSSVIAVEVHTSIGRVAADVSVSPAQGGTASWLPAAAGPSTQLVVPGVPPSGSAAGLVLAVPGTTSAEVNVVAITPQGRYRPFGSQPVELPGESASYTALTPLGGAAALEITSSVPVAAGVVVPGSGAGAITAAAAPVSEQAVVAGNASGSGLSASVLLSAPAGPARVRLTEIAPASRGGTSVTGSQVVPVTAGRTLAVPVTAPSGAARGSAFALVITPLPGSGPVYAARVETQGGGGAIVSVLPAASALTTISLPPVRDSYDAISP